MALEIRNPTQEEYRATLVTRDATFGETFNEADLEREIASIPVDRILAGFDPGPIGLVASYAFDLTIPGGALPTAGVTWVGVLPSHRRRGLLTEMMRRQLEDVHERGEPLAALFASEAPIYGRFGYGQVVPAAELNAERGCVLRDDPGPSGSVRLITAEEAFELFPPIYERVRLTRPGFTSRSESWWRDRRLIDPEHWRHGASHLYYAVLELDGDPAGYALYRIAAKWEEGFPKNEVRLIEAIADAPDAMRELWRFLFGIDLVQRIRCWPFDVHSPLFLMVVDSRRLHLKLTDGLWLRLVDVDVALRKRSYAGEGSVVLEISDRFCPWNEGRYRAGEDAGRTDAEPDLRLSVADLATAYLGDFDFGDLARAGRVEELSEGAVEGASALFRTPEKPYCPEVF